MRKIFTGEYIARLDKYTIDYDNITSIELIERAAIAFTTRFRLYYDTKRAIKIFSGSGKNGADSLAVAILLNQLHYSVEVFFFNAGNSISEEAEFKLNELRTNDNIPLQEIGRGSSFNPPKIRSTDIIIDGIFGTGLNRPVEGAFASLIQFINHSHLTSGCDVISIDIPSGLYCDKNANIPQGAIIEATRTFTFEFPKLAFFFEENAKYTGRVETLSLSLNEEGKKLLPTDYYETTDFDIADLLKQRPLFAHKGFFGHALLVGGSKGKIGAAILAAKGALRSGVGKLTCFVPECAELPLCTALPEAMQIVDPHSEYLSIDPPLHPFHAVGVGPGLGTNEATAKMLHHLLLRAECPIVLDADAINIIAEAGLSSELPEKTILTPHAKELERLVGVCTSSEQRLEEARTYAMRFNVIIILKGAYTAICSPSGQIIFNPVANPALATPGSGDVLTGMITSFLAQKYPPLSAAILACYFHGMAGNIYSGKWDEYSMLASDIAELLPEAFKSFHR